MVLASLMDNVTVQEWDHKKIVEVIFCFYLQAE